MEENLEDIATGGKLNASLPGCRITEDAKHDMITMKETFWGSYKSHVSSCYAKTIFETTSNNTIRYIINLIDTKKECIIILSKINSIIINAVYTS